MVVPAPAGQGTVKRLFSGDDQETVCLVVMETDQLSGWQLIRFHDNLNVCSNVKRFPDLSAASRGLPLPMEFAQLSFNKVGDVELRPVVMS